MGELHAASRYIGLLSLSAALLEALMLKFVFKRSYDWRSGLASIAVALIRTVNLFVPLALALPGAYWLQKHRLFDATSLGVGSWVILFFGVEFLYYWYHRLGHRTRWFWLSHAVHHTPNELNLTTVARLGWTSKITGAYAIFTPLALLGFSPESILTAYSLNLSYQFWIHADWFPKLGPLEGILNTPSAHRVHHAANLEYLDANYGGVLVIFDRLFGTYLPEREDLPCRYGLVHPLHTYNPFKIALHQFGPFLKDLWSARSAREVFGYFFAPPGWRPDGTGETTEDMRRRAAAGRPQAEVTQESAPATAA